MPRPPEKTPDLPSIALITWTVTGRRISSVTVAACQAGPPPIAHILVEPKISAR